MRSRHRSWADYADRKITGFYFGEQEDGWTVGAGVESITMVELTGSLGNCMAIEIRRTTGEMCLFRVGPNSNIVFEKEE